MFIFCELSTQKLERIIAFKVKLFAKLKFSHVKPRCAKVFPKLLLASDRINNVFNI